MDRKSHLFSSLSENEMDVILDRAKRERDEAIATAVAWLGRWLRAALLAPTAWFRATARRYAPPRHPLPH